MGKPKRLRKERAEKKKLKKLHKNVGYLVADYYLKAMERGSITQQLMRAMGNGGKDE